MPRRAGRRARRACRGRGPTIPADGAIPGAPEPLPETMDYDAAKQRLVIGKGYRRERHAGDVGL